MQMRKTYQSTNKKVRAEKARQDARECERAGMLGLAQVNYEIAAWLDPIRDIEEV